MRRFEEKTVLVTGSTTGIGEATVREFAAEGAQVMITGRNAERGKKVLADIKAQGGNADFLQTDIKD
jgi:NAD(P)-dependent dehydrogenase (short-subunit alcohol dehydrogenase family)